MRRHYPRRSRHGIVVIQPRCHSNAEKARIRQLFSEGKATRQELLEAESASYHSAGTCTFCGTANTNQMLLEIMGLQLPGSSFVNPGTELRDKLTDYAGEQVLKFTAAGNDYRPIGQLVDERAVVNGIVGLLATGGSTNQTLHLVAIARAAGVQITMNDFSALSEIVPMLCQIYSNGLADINRFHAVGGMPYLVSTLLENGYFHQNTQTISNNNTLVDYQYDPTLSDGKLRWISGADASLDHNVLRDAREPFSASGGLIGKVQDDDIIRLDTYSGQLQVLVENSELMARETAVNSAQDSDFGTGRELFSLFRNNVSDASSGACVLGSFADEF